MRTEKCSLCENSKKKWGGLVRGGGGSGWGGQGGCEWRSGEAFVKIKKKNIFFLGGGVGLGGSGWMGMEN